MTALDATILNLLAKLGRTLGALVFEALEAALANVAAWGAR